MIRNALPLLAAAALSVWARPNPYPAVRQAGNYMHNYYIPPAPGSTPWAPCWSPDGKWIAVAMQGSIWKVDPRTGGAEELTYGTTYHSSPAWSPDGRWIVYTADDDGAKIQLEILDLKSGRTRALTSDSQVYLDPIFSPDGMRLAYVSSKPNGHFNIFVRPIRDGDWAGEEIAVTRDNQYPRDRLYFGPWDMHTQPAWAPDGKEIVFVSNRGVPLGAGDLWRMPAEPDGILKAKRILAEQTLYRTRPHVSIDGKRILYSSTGGAADQFDNLYVIPIEGGAPYELTFGEFDRFHPRWSPDGEWIAYISNDGGLPQLALLETYGGANRVIRITSRKWKRPMGTLRVRVIDAGTDKPTPARVHLNAADGKFYTPTDVYSRIGASGRHLFHTAGAFTVELPAGTVTVEALKGFEFIPALAKTEVPAGGDAELTLTLRRLADFSAKGWHNGSMHVHMNYGGNLRNTPENLLLMSDAEDQDFLNAQAANKDNRVLDHQYFAPGGGEHPASRGRSGSKLIFGQEYRPPFHGHTSLFGLRDHLMSPFTTGYEGTAIESLYPTNTDIFRKARAQGAVTTYVHPYGDADPLPAGLGNAKAFPVDAALGTVDALEWSDAGRGGLIVWHHVLNNDLPVAPVGGEDSITDLHRSKLIGSARAYAWLGSDVSAEAWLDAIRGGRTFFSTGPLLEFRVDGKIPGETVRLPAEGGTISIEASAVCIAPLSKVEIHHNGKVLMVVPLAADKKSASLKTQLKLTGSGWLSLYAEGPAHPYFDATFLQAATNAVRVYVGGQKIRSRESAEYFVQWIDKLSRMTADWLWWRSEQEKTHVLGQFGEARAVYERLASEAGEH
ncbi:MAG TPA: CehA/McbA family metallohydrolase [Bryobacteraceae bacterium]|nr:CehA/McbA family metallohydrolase [Bryobacteraceae bacterium]